MQGTDDLTTVLERIFHRTMELVQEELQYFADDLEGWLADLFARLPDADWRGELRDFVELWHRQNIAIAPHSVRALEEWLAACQQQAAELRYPSGSPPSSLRALHEQIEALPQDVAYDENVELQRRLAAIVSQRGTEQSGANFQELDKSLHRSASVVAFSEKQRIGLTSDEQAQYENHLIRNFYHQWRGEPLENSPDFWLDKNYGASLSQREHRQWLDSQPAMGGITADRSAASEAQYKLLHPEQTPVDEYEKLQIEDAVRSQREYYERAGGGWLWGTLDRLFDPAWGGQGNLDDILMILGGFGAVPSRAYVPPIRAPEPIRPIAEPTPAAAPPPEPDLGRDRRGVWNLAPVVRGNVIEDLMGRNMPRNFPRVDREEYFRGVYVSIKSIDLTSETYLKASNLASTLRTYVNSTAEFNGDRVGGIEVKPEQIRERVLTLIVTPGPPDPAQRSVFPEIIEYGRQRNVIVQVVSMPN